MLFIIISLMIFMLQRVAANGEGEHIILWSIGFVVLARDL
jgi:hypothetical protein